MPPTVSVTQRARHHLFPRAWLEKQGVSDLKLINQMANYALLEWPENIAISDTTPDQYVRAIRDRFAPAEWDTMRIMHALPDGWEMLDYAAFLGARRKLMAAIIRRGFETLV